MFGIIGVAIAVIGAAITAGSTVYREEQLKKKMDELNTKLDQKDKK